MSRTLGSEIRGARLGYGWCDELGAYVRLTRAGTSGILVDVRSADAIPRRGDDSEHYVWWAGDARRSIGRTLRRLVAGDLRRVQVRRDLLFVVPDATRVR